MMPAWIVFFSALELGIANGGYQITAPDDPSVIEGDCRIACMYTRIEARIELWDILFVAASVDTLVRPRSLFRYQPFEDTYTVSAGLMFGPVTVAFSHWCCHPVLSQQGGREDWYYGGENRISVRIESPAP